MNGPEFFQLQSPDGGLTLQLMNPEHQPRWYPGTRFAAAGFITRVQYRGHDYFYSPADDGRFQKGIGLPMEFDLGERLAPPGYEDAAPGEGFLKIGVGVLPRPDEKGYRFNIPYEVLEAPVRAQNVQSDQAIFLERVMQGIRGLAYQLVTLVKLEGHRLLLRYELTNTGNRAFTTEQYLHNFVALDPNGLSDQLTLELPFDFELNTQPYGLNCQGLLVQRGRTMRFSGVELERRCAKLPIMATPEALKKHHLVLRDQRTGRTLTISGSMPVNQWSFFLSAEQISPEAFVKLTVAPEETVRWRRCYDFA